jgi:hypothetical protein
MMVWVLGEFLAGGLQEVCQQALAINKQALGRIVAAFKRESGFISGNRSPDLPLFITHSR